ncbi:hypothetical protein AVEN_245684-1 [Araneus ventricosus]|uniref:DUF7041 domain-containing protein n=1 Tax=Araneus ventricosus TaxID=182803 RepID=A0A4Y2NYB6_ARAVE|nr:hypothetical protein AVEN_245684-1 [Araneus ventricosus]
MDDGETSVSNTTDEKYEAKKVSVEIPSFWEEKPEIWFFHVEAYFSIANITQDQTKFNYLVAQLEPKMVENIWNIIQSERNDKYVAAKERLLSTFKESEEKSITKLLTGISLGDMKPSQLLLKMKSLGGTNITDKVLLTLCLGKIPESIKNILVVSNENLDNLSIMADKIFEMNSTTEIYSAAADNSVMNTVLDKISNLENQISELNVHRQSRSKYRHFDFNRSNSRSHSRKKHNPNGSNCYYHFKFVDKCYPNECKSPCSCKASENSDQQ